jgi:hypothetical protein
MTSELEPAQGNVVSVGLQSEASGTGDDDLIAVEDGHRAVQTINRLLTNTVSNTGYFRSYTD